MKRNNWLLGSSAAFLYFSLFVSSLSAQDPLPVIVKKISPSVVLVLSYDEKGTLLKQGTGFFINKNGEIITNHHVLRGASRAEVKTKEGKVYPLVRILAEDTRADLTRASVGIPQESVHPLALSTAIPEVGERVIVIGNPLGLESSVSDGIVSAVRAIPEFGKVIQVTAPLSPGSSGSPVINLKGEVVGVAAFQLTEGQNLNFAIPSEKIAGLTPTKEQPLGKWGEGAKEDWLASEEGLYYTGIAFLLAEDYETALRYFAKAVEKNAGNPDAYFQVGYCNDKLGRYSEAVEAFKQAIRIKPDDAEAHYNLGVAYAKLGRYSEALEAFKQAIRIRADFSEAHHNLGVAYAGLGRYSDAVEAFKQAIRIKPDYAEAHFGLGFAYGKLGRYSEAVEAHKQVVRIKPDVAEAHYYLGVAYLSLGRYSEALEAFKQAIRIKPDYAEAQCDLGLAYGKLGRHSEAVEAYKQAIRIKPDFAEAHKGLGASYGSLGRFSEAVEAFKQAIRIKPDYAEAHFALGVSYLLLEDKGAALDEYKILKTLNAELANKLFNMIYQ
ncbi:MAG: tetratricopeptide repeat protein [Acidobacteriota bacterium]